MLVRVDYGRGGQVADLPDENLIAVLGLTPAPPVANPDATVESALRSPIGTASLSDLAHGARNACIVICDITRPVPNSQLLPPVLRTLESCGLPSQAITILIATGTHRPNLGAEIRTLVGREIADRYRVVNHDCRDVKRHIWLGQSANGVPAWIDRTYVEADLKVTVGLIEPHFMAGYSGGRKLIMPGLAAMETVEKWHCPRFLESPNATSGIVDCNPVHAEALSIAQLAPPDLILDVTLDEENRITGVFAGDLERAWRTGVDFARRHVTAEIAQQADIVVTSGAGYPLDQTFYQAVKGMVAAMPAVRRGGTIIIAAECAEGIGSDHFARTLLDATDLEEFVSHISKPGVFLPEQWQVEELARAARHAEIVCVTTGVNDVDLARCFVTPAISIDAAVSNALKKHGPRASIIAIPRGPYVIPTNQQNS